MGLWQEIVLGVCGCASLLGPPRLIVIGAVILDPFMVLHKSLALLEGLTLIFPIHLYMCITYNFLCIENY